MKNVFLRSLIITLIFQISGLFPMVSIFTNIFDFKIVRAQSPAVPIYSVYRDALGGENISPTPQALSWDTAVSSHPEIPIDGANTRFDLSVGGHYLIMYSASVQSTGGNNRSEIQSWIRVNGSDNSPYTYGSSYIRRIDNDFEGYNEGAAIVELSPGDDIELMMQRTDTNTAGVMRSPERSGINILKLDDAWDYARLRPSIAQPVTTTWSDVDLGTVDELDNGEFSVSGNGITLASAGKYLVSYNLATITTGTDRTNNETRLTLGGVELEATRSTAYVRAQNGSFEGIASYVGIIDSSVANQVLHLEMRRESSLQGTTNNTLPTKTGFTITKLPDSADYLMIGEAVGGQDISTSPTPLTFDTTLEQGTSLVHDGVNRSEIDINTPGDYLLFHSIYNTRTGTSNLFRENPYLRWRVSGIDIGYGVSGSYNRHSNDNDGITNSSASSAGLILPSLGVGDTLELIQQNEASNGESVYAAERMGIQGVNLQSLFQAGAYISQPSYRWRDDSSDFDTDAGWLAGENTSITNISKNQVLRLRMKVENPTSEIYTDPAEYELQWAQGINSCNSGLSWNSISNPGDDWEMFDSAFISPNGETSATQLLSNPNFNIHLQSEGYHAPDGRTSITSGGAFTSGRQKEYEFSLRSSSFLQPESMYCFRLFDRAQNAPLSVNNYPMLQTGSTPVVLDDVWGEAGSVIAPANGGWTTINYIGGPYTTPVIVGRSNTHNDPAEALVFEARNVTSSSAQVRLCDSNAGNAVGCQPHLAETIGYIIVDASQTSSIDGIEAGIFLASESFDTGPGNITTTYTETFSTTPYVFSSIQTTNGASPIVTRVNNSTVTNFSGGICRQNSQDGCDPAHPTESFGWIAVDPNVNPFFKNMDIGTGLSTTPSQNWNSATFSTSFSTPPVAISQTVTNNGGQDVQIDEIQNITTSGMQFRACELDNDDDCDTHAIDDIRWLALEEGVFAAEYLLDATHYRWYENNGANTPVTPLADENTTLSTIPINNQLRLRMLLQNASPELPANVLSLRLQYAAGTSCETVSAWTPVGSVGGGEDWLHFDTPTIADGVVLTNSLLFDGGHSLQRYSETSPTAPNPNIIPVGEWGEWDFSLIKNPAATGQAYCFRVVTENNNEIAYSSYATINSSDTTDPVINSFTPGSGALLPIGNFFIDYSYSDADSGVNSSNPNFYIQRWNGSSYGGDLAGSYVSLDTITTTQARYNVSNLPFGRYRAGFEIFDNAGNSSFVLHELYVDEVEFIISDPEIDIGNIFDAGLVYSSADSLSITVRTLGAAFDVTMIQQTDMQSDGDIIPDWDGSTGFGYEINPFGNITSFGTGNIILTQSRNIHPDGEKYTYTTDIRYSALLELLENYSAGDYESLLDFRIHLDYN